MHGGGCLCRKDLFQMLLLKPCQRAEIHKRMICRLQFVVQLLRPPQRGTRLRCERTAQRGGSAYFLSLRIGKLRCRVEPEVPRCPAVKAEIAGHRDKRQSILRQNQRRELFRIDRMRAAPAERARSSTACKKSSASPSSLSSVYTRPNDVAVSESSTAPRQV